MKANDLLQHCTGTFHYYRHLNGYTYTDGVAEFAEMFGAYWLIDLIVSHQHTPLVQVHDLQIWKLKLTDDGGCKVWAEDGNGCLVASQRVPFTDFPHEEAELWLSNGVVLLPSEY